MLRGRRNECTVLDALLDEARDGRSGVLVLRGEAGIGKTALLEQASESASDFMHLRAVGVESEMELAFAGLHQLCAPIHDVVDRLPAPQREALETGSEEAVLRTEQLIDDRLRNTRATSEPIHRRLREPTLGEQLLTELDELPFPHNPRHPTVTKVLYSRNSFHTYSQ